MPIPTHTEIAHACRNRPRTHTHAQARAREKASPNVVTHLILVKVLPGHEQNAAGDSSPRRRLLVERPDHLGREDATPGTVMQQELVGIHVLQSHEGLGVALRVLDAAQLFRQQVPCEVFLFPGRRGVSG